MTITITDVSDLDLAALLCSKVCHDVIGPVGAIINGLEVLEDDQDEEMQEIAHDLIRKSAAQASAKLQFCRLAFGASGSSGASIDLTDAEVTARRYVEGHKVELNWSVPLEVRPKNEVKLLLNLVLMVLSGIPRGGVLNVEMQGQNIRVTATGQGGRVPRDLADFASGEFSERELDARSVQIHYTVALARSLGLEVNVIEVNDGLEVAAVPPIEVAA